MNDAATVEAFDGLLAVQTELNDMIEGLRAAQEALADATVALGESSGLLTA